MQASNAGTVDTILFALCRRQRSHVLTLAAQAALMGADAVD
ncbi:MAG: hypothetical protein ABIT23_03800 [Nitrosospira sp.]